MPTIDQLTECVPPVSPNASVADVFGWFTKNPDALALPVVEDGRPVGLIDRHDFLQKLAEPLGHSRYGSRPIERIMDAEPAVVEYNVRISAFSEVILKNSAGAMMRGFIVTRNGQYMGVGTAIALLHRVNHEQSEQIAKLQSELQYLATSHDNGKLLASAKNDFVNILAEELDAPLRNIQTFTSLLEKHPISNGAHEHVSAIRSACEDSINLLRNARDLTSIETDAIALETKPVLLRCLLDKLVINWADRAKEAQVTIMASYEGDTELVAMLDEARFLNTYDTLIECSLRLVRNGIIELGLKAEAINNQIHIKASVRDDGPGLDEDQLIKPFADLGLSGNLSIANATQLLKHLNGRIWAENNAGHGSTYAFNVAVPLYVPEAEDNHASQLEGFNQNAKPHVLIADDNATNRVVAQALCEMFGCTSVAVEDGQEALEAVKTNIFDLVLMDIKMPRMDGVEATRAIRDLPCEASRVPVIALTANADPDDVAGYIEAGMLCVVEKPIKPERLRMAMNLALSPPTEAAPTKVNAVKSLCRAG